ncbi:MAG: hypothetical protein WCC53_16010 [Thermoanaerobaculia bacterium]|jgi:hypothetical protein
MNPQRRGVVLSVVGMALVVLAPSALGAGPYQYFAVTPCRAVDTRSTARVTNAAFANFTIKNVCNVPSSAVAVSLNLTVVAPTAAGYLSIWPTGGTAPNVSTMNYASGEPAIANGAIVPVGTGTPDLTLGIGPCPISCPAASPTYQMDVIIDVTGYFQ